MSIKFENTVTPSPEQFRSAIRYKRKGEKLMSNDNSTPYTKKPKQKRRPTWVCFLQTRKRDRYKS